MCSFQPDIRYLDLGTTDGSIRYYRIPPLATSEKPNIFVYTIASLRSRRHDGRSREKQIQAWEAYLGRLCRAIARAEEVMVTDCDFISVETRIEGEVRPGEWHLESVTFCDEDCSGSATLDIWDGPESLPGLPEAFSDLIGERIQTFTLSDGASVGYVLSPTFLEPNFAIIDLGYRHGLMAAAIRRLISLLRITTEDIRKQKWFFYIITGHEVCSDIPEGVVRPLRVPLYVAHLDTISLDGLTYDFQHLDEVPSEVPDEIDLAGEIIGEQEELAEQLPEEEIVLETFNLLLKARLPEVPKT